MSCSFCATLLGWKYEGAEEEGQRYKIGKFILETRRIRAESCWEMGGVGGGGGGGRGGWDGEEEQDNNNNKKKKKKGEGVGSEFDSGDEDQCEDLFSGVWSEALMRRRREARAVMR